MMNAIKLGADSVVGRLSTILMMFTLFFTGLANRTRYSRLAAQQ